MKRRKLITAVEREAAAAAVTAAAEQQPAASSGTAAQQQPTADLPVRPQQQQQEPQQQQQQQQQQKHKLSTVVERQRDTAAAGIQRLEQEMLAAGCYVAGSYNRQQMDQQELLQQQMEVKLQQQHDAWLAQVRGCKTRDDALLKQLAAPQQQQPLRITSFLDGELATSPGSSSKRSGGDERPRLERVKEDGAQADRLYDSASPPSFIGKQQRVPTPPWRAL